MKVESAVYKPFGEQSEWVLPGNAAPETKGWIGERYDADAGLQYLNARYYDPELSLFLQPDWFEVTKAGVGTNRFSYSFNDPVNKLDPGGSQTLAERATAFVESVKDWAAEKSRDVKAASNNLGDLVWGLDAKGVGGWHVVLGQTVATYDHEVRVTIRDLETGTEQTITSNRIHPYFAQVPEGEIVPAASEGFTYDGPLARGHWIDAGNLKPGYRLLNPDGTWAEVVSVAERPVTLDAWNLTVENAHSYFVAEKEGAEPVWVHNSCFDFSDFKYMHEDMKLGRYTDTPTDEIVDSLFTGPEPLLVDKHGTIWKGNERVRVLEERGYDLSSIRDRLTQDNLYERHGLGNPLED